MEVLLNNKHQFAIYQELSTDALKEIILEKLGITSDEFYLTQNGRLINNDQILYDGRVNIVPRLLGGKGGFGSMLRAIGAQIEKTTNREACRDLSGRRLRDINEEQRLKNWIAQQADRERETAERKKKKLERLCEKPKHEFKDEEYDKERSALPEEVENAVLQGLQASCSSNAAKRKADDKKTKKKKKPKLWVDDELEDLSADSSEEGSDSDDAKNSKSDEDTTHSESATSTAKEAPVETPEETSKNERQVAEAK